MQTCKPHCSSIPSRWPGADGTTQLAGLRTLLSEANAFVDACCTQGNASNARLRRPLSYVPAQVHPVAKDLWVRSRVSHAGQVGPGHRVAGGGCTWTHPHACHEAPPCSLDPVRRPLLQILANLSRCRTRSQVLALDVLRLCATHQQARSGLPLHRKPRSSNDGGIHH